MTHPAQIKFCNDIKKRFPEYFEKKRVLDVGSLDINGNNKYLFNDCEYIGLDVIEGKNVDVVSVAHKYKSDEFDVVLSTNALEHDIFYKLTLQNMFSLLKPEGLMFFSVANSWKEHGTERTSPKNSGTSKMGIKWKNYYKNLTPNDIKNSLDLDYFKEYEMEIFKKDLIFWGIKDKNKSKFFMKVNDISQGGPLRAQYSSIYNKGKVVVVHEAKAISHIHRIVKEFNPQLIIE